MRTGFLKLLGACAAVFALNMPASAAFTFSLEPSGQDLKVSLTNLAPPETINTYDVYLTMDAGLWGQIEGLTLSGALGPLDPSLSGFDFTSIQGEVNAYAVPTKSNADLAADQTDPLLLFTVSFNAGADLRNAVFNVGSGTVVGCAAPDPNTANPNPNYSVQCFPNAVPEPTSLALICLALAGAGFASRRRSAVV